MTKPHVHATHPALLVRLKRADDHLRAVIVMIAEGKHCLNVGQQRQAVEKAVASAKKTLIHDHMDHCLNKDHSPADRDSLKAITRYL